jgi:hypothetical protein
VVAKVLSIGIFVSLEVTVLAGSLAPLSDTASHVFSPALISAPLSDGLRIAFNVAIAASLGAAVASWLRGAKYVHSDGDVTTTRRRR